MHIASVGSGEDSRKKLFTRGSGKYRRYYKSSNSYFLYRPYRFYCPWGPDTTPGLLAVWLPFCCRVFLLVLWC